jgi:hypothetical protein
MRSAILLSILLPAALALACRHAATPRAAATAPERPLLFACGDKTCDARTTYCELVQTDVPSIPSWYNCRPLPEACRVGADQTPDCACFPERTKCSFCSQLERKGVRYLQRTCVGGA